MDEQTARYRLSDDELQAIGLSPDMFGHVTPEGPDDKRAGPRIAALVVIAAICAVGIIALAVA